MSRDDKGCVGMTGMARDDWDDQGGLRKTSDD